LIEAAPVVRAKRAEPVGASDGARCATLERMTAYGSFAAIATLAACGASGDTSRAGPAAPQSTAASPAPSAKPIAADGEPFAIHVVRGFGREPTADDPDGAWARFLTSASLDEVLVADADIEAVATEPLTLVLTADAGRNLLARFGPVPEHRFVVSLGRQRLFAGRVMFVGTARALRHPVIHVNDTGFALHIVVLPTLGALADTAVTAPPVVLEHFRAAGKLLPPGAPAAPRMLRRSWLAEATSTKPGEPTTRVAATCDAAACSLTLSFRRPGGGADTWDVTETVALDRGEFEVVWSVIERQHLTSFDPRPRPDDGRIIHRPRYRLAFSAERVDDAKVAIDRAWQTPSTGDAQAESFLTAAGALGRRRAIRVPVRYFPGAP
jgi:hypothetical protein